MSSSIRTGLNELLRIDPDIDGVVITLCDQPFVDAQSIDRLVNAFLETGKQIVAAKYDDVVGVPALFSRDMFRDLSELRGDKGARDLIRNPKVALETIELNEAAVDIDTIDDFDRLAHRSS